VERPVRFRVIDRRDEIVERLRETLSRHAQVLEAYLAAALSSERADAALRARGARGCSPHIVRSWEEIVE
jgi:sugar-specific transcriptional regulator TrmB